MAGKATNEPRDMILEKRPLIEPDGWCMSVSCQCCLSIAETNMLTVIELVQRQQTVNHGSIVTVGCRCQNGEGEQKVGRPKVRLAPPRDVGELSSSNAEVAWGRGRRHSESRPRGATDSSQGCLRNVERGLNEAEDYNGGTIKSSYSPKLQYLEHVGL